jgi:hypothetical protein
MVIAFIINLMKNYPLARNKQASSMSGADFPYNFSVYVYMKIPNNCTAST